MDYDRLFLYGLHVFGVQRAMNERKGSSTEESGLRCINRYQLFLTVYQLVS
jgi:hypothetical protein